MEIVFYEIGVFIYFKVIIDFLVKKGEDGDIYIIMVKWNIDKVMEGVL